MVSRLDLQHELVNLLGSNNVYFQPPESVKMKYPAIVYSRNDIRNQYADDNVYSQSHVYQIIVIDKDPDSDVVEKVSRLPSCVFDRHYIANNLNHDVFRIYY